MPRWAALSVELAVAVNICAAIVGIGFLADRYTHAPAEAHALRVPAGGFWFCLGGMFGNGCWD